MRRSRPLHDPRPARLPGRQNQHWHSDNPTHWAEFWNHRHFQDRVVHLWEAIAERYKDRPEVAGYNPVNEPADASGTAIGPFYERLEHAVRAVDRRHVLFLDGNRYSTDFSIFGGPFPNTVYTAHDYALPGIAAGSTYPGVTRGEFFDRDAVERTFLRRTAFMRDTGTPRGSRRSCAPSCSPSRWSATSAGVSRA
ncbi:glycoside hydrolase family 5 protein [Nonomuraea diastatica]|uniref:glycoside hydrolase family 5 protein n=1 Tax=Nonomuraea diastatica TaxID=1848329 RepID=UPI00319DCC50